VKIVRWSALLVAAMLVAACGANSGASSSAPSSASVPAGSSVPAAAGSPPAGAVLARQMNSAVAKATSVHIRAALSQGGNPVTTDLSLTRANDMYGQLVYKNAPLTVLVTQGHTYIKVTSATLKALGLPSAACVLMCNKYLKMTAGQSQRMTGGLGWSSTVGSLNSILSLHYAGPATVNGQPAWQMHAGTGAIYVAAQGPAYPLRIVTASDRVDFTQWNSVTIPPPPPASQVVDISQLKHL